MLAVLWTTFLNIRVLESYLSQQRKENRSEEVNGFVLRLRGAVWRRRSPTQELPAAAAPALF